MSTTIFTDGTLYATNKLGMINICLAAIGEVPYPDGTLIEDIVAGTDAFSARKAVEETMVEVQNRGWYFNTDNNYLLVPDTFGFISVSPNTLRVDFGTYRDKGRYTLRGKRLYDKKLHTFKIGRATECDIVWLVDYEELPPAAYQYIALRAARKFQQRIIGSQELAMFTEQDELDAYANMQREQLQYEDYNFKAKDMNRLSGRGGQ